MFPSGTNNNNNNNNNYNNNNNNNNNNDDDNNKEYLYGATCPKSSWRYTIAKIQRLKFNKKLKKITITISLATIIRINIKMFLYNI